MMRPHKDVRTLGVILLAAISAMGLLRAPQAAEAPVAPSTQAPAVAPSQAKPASPATSASKVPVAAAVKVTEVEGITEYRLSNGLRVLLFPDQSKPTITVNVTYLVGSRHENYGETGMAHLLEHMMFKGTPKNPDIGKEFNSRGMRFNGTTSLDRTNYYELFQANEANLAWALQMEADRMVHSFIARKDLDTEMTVVRNEYESGENSPQNVLIKRLQSMAYDWHNYGHSTIGNRSDIENVEIGNLQAFYHLYYQPDNAVLLVAGKFDAARTLQVITAQFGAIARPTRVLPKLWTVEPTQDGERSFVVRRVGDMQVIALGYKSPSAVHPDAQALRFASQILGDTPSGRLHKALVETGKAAQIGFGQVNGIDGSLQILLAQVKQGDPVEPVQAEMLRIVEDFGKTPPTEAEMARVRGLLANQFERVLNDHETIGLQLSEFAALGDWRMFFLIRDRAAKVSAAEVQTAAGQYFRRDNRIAGLFQSDDKPQRAQMPAVVSAAEVLRDFKPKAATAEAEDFDPSPDNIDRRTKRIEVNGMKIALLQKKNRGETVFVNLSLPAGDEKSLFGQRAAGLATGQMLMRGTSKYTREQLQDEFVKLKVAGGVNGRGAAFQTTRPNVAAAIRLGAHVLREPSFPPAEFEQYKKLTVTAIEAQLRDPLALAFTTLSHQFNTYPKGDVRYSQSLQEQLDDIKAVTLEDVKRYYKTFYGANRAQIAIVGDFDETEVIKAITEGLGGWQSETPYTRVTSLHKDVAPTQTSIQTTDKENAMLAARLNVDVNEDDADYPALYLANYMLGGGAGMDARLMARIRVKEGLSYGVSSGLGAGRFDRDGLWVMQAIAAPQNVEKVEAAFKEELAKMLKDGFTAEELAKAKSGVTQQGVQARAQDQRLAGNLLANIDSGRSFAWDKQFEARIMALTPGQVLAAARKYIDPAKITIVKAGDFAKLANAK